MKGEIISIETARIMADIEKENKMLIEALEINHKIIDKYEDRINKAIEYMEKLKNFKIKYVMLEEKELYASEKDFVKDLLNILQGSDKE